MTLPRLYALMDHWQENPPTHRLLNNVIRAFDRPPEKQGSMEDLAALCGGMGIEVK